MTADEIDERRWVQHAQRGPLSVVRVSPDDSLAVHQQPGPSTKVVFELKHDQRSIEPLAGACEIGQALWLEVKVGSSSGWVDSAFLAATSTPRDRTAEYQSKLGGGGFSSPAALLDALNKSIARPDGEEGVFKAEVVGITRKGTRAKAVFHQCCFADDSVAGEQAWLELRQSAGQWRLTKATQVSLCRRGVSGDLCL